MPKRTKIAHNKNTKLLARIHEKWNSVAHFCQESGIRQMDVGRLINGSGPFQADGMWRKATLQVVEALQAPPEELFDPEQLEDGDPPWLDPGFQERLAFAGARRAERERSLAALGAGPHAPDFLDWLRMDSGLADSKQRLVQELYFEGTGLAEMAAITRTSHQNVKRTEELALRMLRRPLAGPAR